MRRNWKRFLALFLALAMIAGSGFIATNSAFRANEFDENGNPIEVAEQEVEVDPVEEIQVETPEEAAEDVAEEAVEEADEEEVADEATEETVEDVVENEPTEEVKEEPEEEEIDLVEETSLEGQAAPTPVKYYMNINYVYVDEEAGGEAKPIDNGKYDEKIEMNLDGSLVGGAYTSSMIKGYDFWDIQVERGSATLGEDGKYHWSNQWSDSGSLVYDRINFHDLNGESWPQQLNIAGYSNNFEATTVNGDVERNINVTLFFFPSGDNQDDEEEPNDSDVKNYNLTIRYEYADRDPKSPTYNQWAPIPEEAAKPVTVPLNSDGTLPNGVVAYPELPNYILMDMSIGRAEAGGTQRFNAINKNSEGILGIGHGSGQISGSDSMISDKELGTGDTVESDYIITIVYEKAPSLTINYVGVDESGKTTLGQETVYVDFGGKVVGGSKAAKTFDSWMISKATADTDDFTLDVSDGEKVEVKGDNDSVYEYINKMIDSITRTDGDFVLGDYTATIEFVKIPTSEGDLDPEEEQIPEKTEPKAYLNVKYLMDDGNGHVTTLIDKDGKIYDENGIELDVKLGYIKDIAFEDGLVKGGVTTPIVEGYSIKDIAIEGASSIGKANITADQFTITGVLVEGEDVTLDGTYTVVITYLKNEQEEIVEENIPEQTTPGEDETPEEPVEEETDEEVPVDEDIQDDAEDVVNEEETTEGGPVGNIDREKLFDIFEVEFEDPEIVTTMLENPVVEAAPAEVPVAETTFVAVNDDGNGNISLTEIEDIETALANQDLGGHICNILYFLILLATSIVLFNYFRSAKKHNERIFELRSQLGEDDPFRDEEKMKH